MPAGHRQPLGHKIHAEHAVRTHDLALRAANWPTGPSPYTATVPPVGMSAYRAACHPVGRMSDRYRKRSSGGPSGTWIGPNWACGTRRNSAWPPGTWPYSLV